MKYISMLYVLLASFCLLSCSVISKDKVQFEQIADDFIEEIAEDSIKL